MLEVEKKYAIADREELIRRLVESGASPGKIEDHADTYFRHPSRNFSETNEALRIRSVDQIASVTYKGPKLDLGDRTLKAREEIEWCLAPGDTDGSRLSKLFAALGFTPVTTVRKQRLSFSWPSAQVEYADVTLTVDQVDQVGAFAEIELLIEDDSQAAVRMAAGRINTLAERMGLLHPVQGSYLQMFLAITSAAGQSSVD